MIYIFNAGFSLTEEDLATLCAFSRHQAEYRNFPDGLYSFEEDFIIEISQSDKITIKRLEDVEGQSVERIDINTLLDFPLFKELLYSIQPAKEEILSLVDNAVEYSFETVDGTDYVVYGNNEVRLSTDAVRYLIINKRGKDIYAETGLTDKDLERVGQSYAEGYGGNLIDYEVDKESGEITVCFNCVEYGELFCVSSTIAEIKQELKEIKEREER